MDSTQYHYTALPKGDEPLVSEEYSSAGPSTLPPPAFEESAGHVVIDINDSDIFIPEGGEPPPDFTPYEAEYSVSDNGDIVSHDPHLNEDGEALYRFLLSQAANHPKHLLHCSGTHEERRTRLARTRSDHGKFDHESESYTETVTDFDFYIDVGQHISGPIHWSVADSEPAYRGLMVRQVDTPTGRRNVSRKEVSVLKGWKKERTAWGLPPWVVSGWTPESQGPIGPSSRHEGNFLQSSKTMRQWADEYCASPKCLKEFRYEKVVYGWNVRSLKNALVAAIKSTSYHGNISVEFQTSASKISIRPDNRLSRILSNKWIKFLLIILLVYPFIWLFKRFHHRGGGRWEVCGGAYALKEWRSAYQHDASDSKNRQKRSVGGRTQVLVGTREGEWFRDWEATIREAVVSRTQSQSPLTVPSPSRRIPEAHLLDGYTDGE